jgi:nucleotide-binding universal stress UspA family protein
MKAIETTRVTLKNILFLTDFSEPSEAALPFAVAIAREFGATIHALHILVPSPYIYTSPGTSSISIAAEEDNAQVEMQHVEARLAGVPHELIVRREVGIWPALERAIADCSADLIVLGTHGRTGAQKLFLGSAAEEILRRVQVPVLTIGPGVRNGTHNGAHFQRVLFATDFTSESVTAARYAVSLAEENQARLILLHVVRGFEADAKTSPKDRSVANIMYRLYSLTPKDAELWCRPEAVVEHGEPAARILEAAKQRNADLVVIGVGAAVGFGTTHLETSIAHKIVAHAPCAVLTVKG